MYRSLMVTLLAVLLAGCSRSFWTAPSKRRRALDNYGADVMAVASDRGLPYAYLMTLTVLECSGERPCKTRRELGRFNDLQALRDGSLKRFENIRAVDVHDASDEALWNLATSWGPFQIMGYKCIGLGVNVADIRGDRSLHHGARWIREDYGHLLDQGRFKDALHWHNAGSTYPSSGKPRTYDPDYVDNGLGHLAWFEDHPPEP